MVHSLFMIQVWLLISYDVLFVAQQLRMLEQDSVTDSSDWLGWAATAVLMYG